MIKDHESLMGMAPLVIAAALFRQGKLHLRTGRWLRSWSGRRAVVPSSGVNSSSARPARDGDRAGRPAHSRNGSRRDANQMFAL